MPQRSIWTKQSFWCKKNSIIVVEQLWKKVFCCTCCEQGPCFNYVWSLVANIQSPSEGEKRNQYFFSIHLVGWLFWVFDTLTFCSLWMCPGYTYRVSSDWLRAVKSGFVQCFKHSPQCPASASYPRFTPALRHLIPSHWWELGTGGYITKAKVFLHDKTQVQALPAAARPLLTGQQCWIVTDPQRNFARQSWQ